MVVLLMNPFDVVPQILVPTEFQATLAAHIFPAILEMHFSAMVLQGMVTADNFTAEFTWPGFFLFFGCLDLFSTCWRQVPPSYSSMFGCDCLWDVLFWTG